jgi:predicted DNA-binding ArsR family transcriptional regulator
MGSKHPPFPRSHDVRRAVFLSAILLLGGVMSGRVLAQPGNADENPAGAGVAVGLYGEDPVDQTQKTKMNKDIGPMLNPSGNLADKQQQDEFDTYYKTYALPRWTQLSTLSNLRGYHQELFSNLARAKSGQVHDHLNQLVLDYMGKIAKSDKYHPAVRINAMLTIGDLNSVDSIQTAQNIPLADAMPILLETVNDSKQIVPVRIAALVGINRHVTAGVSDPQIQNPIFSAILKLVTGADAADLGRVWMRKQAVDILGLLGNLGTNNQVATLLSAYAGDTKAPYFLRLSAAEALGKLKYAGAIGLNPVALAKSLAQLMLDACDVELKTKGTPAADRQRRLKARLASAMFGLNGDGTTFKGITPLAKDPAQVTAISNLKAIFDGLLKILDKDISKLSDDEKQKYNDDLKKGVEDCQTKLKDWLEKQP